jgi:ATP-dependent DNA helicase DinG
VIGGRGVLARRLPGFRERPQQLRMADAIKGAFAEGGHLFAEAPTGVGKSLAYLVPAILDLVSARRKVVISTHTIALQDQILEKDLPLLGACLPVEFMAVKAMGRTNYIGLRRLNLALERAATLMEDDVEVKALRRIAAWSAEAREGTRQEITPGPPFAVWEQVQSESDNCLGKKCPTFGNCYFQAARRRLDHADVIVTNHALYFSDLVLRQADAGILPEHQAVVLDEAHHVEAVASEHFGLEVGKRPLLHLLGRLSSRRGPPGVLERLGVEGAERAGGIVEAVRAAVLRFFDSIAEWQAERPGGNGRIRQDFVPDVLSGPLDDLSGLLSEIVERCDRDELRVEVGAFAGRTAGFAAATRQVLAREDEGFVYYVEDALGRDPRVVARPLNVGPLLERELFGRIASVVLTSATLSVDGTECGLDYVAHRLGCRSAKTLVLDSPFDYQRHVEVHVPGRIPFPDEAGFEDQACEVIRRYVERSHGGAFLLFTSYRSLDAFYEKLASRWMEEGILVLRQGGELDRSEILRRFREDGNAVLFGADSFWQGVDVPGPALRLVIITRLPFPVPTHPLHEARAEHLRKSGRSPFFAYSLPEALIRWRQGFGRLIRTEDDEGIVVCLDRRVIERPYGKRFQEALPPCPWRWDGDAFPPES